jgi:5-hydroxyisourate hydrolase
MGRLTTHVLDTARGCPAGGVRIELYRLEGKTPTLLVKAATNRDGRTDKPLAEGNALAAGTYEIVFHLGEYFRAAGSDAGFLEAVPVRFHLADPSRHYHVPLLCSPWSYTTYRGS